MIKIIEKQCDELIPYDNNEVIEDEATKVDDRKSKAIGRMLFQKMRHYLN